ncbi:MAG: cytidylate kinase-like family protein, partial [Deltaproteobacteria bacterium]|nr:cytidylate kinase-like family protein [Deltaproteobacteria bacterium]
MSIIIISSDDHQTGREIAAATAEAMAYTDLGRELLSEAADRHHIAETKLVKALDDAPSFLGMSSKLRALCLSYIQESALGRLLQDNVVCHGLAAHLYVRGVSHVLRVRILSDPERRVQRVIDREGKPPDKAERWIRRYEKARRRWSMAAFGLDEADPVLFDLVISLSQIDQGEAVKIVADTAGYRRFSPMTYSVNCLQDLDLAARARAAMLKQFPDVRVRARSGTLMVQAAALKRERRKRMKTIREVAGAIPGVRYVEVRIIN